MTTQAPRSLTEEAWQRLSESLDIARRLAVGESVYLSAREIKDITRREPRLMTKFDSRSLRPRILGDATILPVNNGQYVIIPGDAYHDVEPPKMIQRWRVPPSVRQLVTLPWSGVPASEGQVLDMAHLSGVLSDFLEEADLVPTIRGRLRSPRFSLYFSHRGGVESIVVEGVQVEVDGGLEGAHINLAEVKLGRWDNFHLRQIYYPVRMWTELESRKTSRAVFVTFSDKVLTLRLYAFEPLDSITAPKLIKAADYEYFFEDEEDAPPDVHQVLARVPPGELSGSAPFPQADRLEKVMDVVDAVAAGEDNALAIAGRYGFDLRQAGYYPAAADFLGLITRKSGRFRLTELGRRFTRLSRRNRHRLVLEQMAGRPVFRQALEWFAAHGGSIPDIEVAADMIVKGWSGTRITGETITRRAQTVRRWLQWLLIDSE